MTPKEMLEKVRDATAGGQFAEADRILQSLLARAPKHAAARKELKKLQRAFQKARENPVRAEEFEDARMAFMAGDLAVARRKVSDLLGRSPDGPSLHNLFGLILNGLGDADGAALAFTRAVKLDDDFAEAHSNLGLQLEELGDLDGAHVALRRANLLEPGRPEYMTNLGALLAVRSDYDDAEKYLRDALKIAPTLAAGWYELGKLLAVMGERDKARAALERAIDLDPVPEGPVSELARLTLFQTGEDPLLQAMQNHWDRQDLPAQERARLGTGLGRAWEQIGDADKAFGYYAAANDIQAKDHPFERSKMDKAFAAAKFCYTADAFAGFPAQPPSQPCPIFIIGLNRSGTTLLEQMLASHSQVTGGDELPFIGDWVDEHGDDPAAYTDEQITLLRDAYLEQLRDIGQTPFVTDKMPANFRWLGLIRRAFPDAPLIAMDRGAMDVCFSNFKSDFGSTGHLYSNDLTDMGFAYLQHRDLMAHWQTVLGDGLHVQSYEALVHDTEAQLRGVLAHCGLGWEDGVLDFHKTKRAVRTLSQSQVREKINTRGIDAWKPFERHLGPLIEVLKEGGAL